MWTSGNHQLIQSEIQMNWKRPGLSDWTTPLGTKQWGTMTTRFPKYQSRQTTG